MKKGKSTDLNQTIFEDTRSFIKNSTLHPYLVVFIGQDSGKRHKLSSGSMTIGRSPQADITIEDDWASRIHCLIHWQGGGDVFELEDRNSTNGTYVNTHKITRVQVPPEPPPNDHPLLNLSHEASERLLLTPHIAGTTRGAFHRMLTGALKNLQTVAGGGLPRHVVNGIIKARSPNAFA